MAYDQPTKGAKVKALEARLGIRDLGQVKRLRALELTRNEDDLLGRAKRIRNSGRWKRLSRMHRKAFPLCQPCERRGLVVPATSVDHVVPLVDRFDLAYEWENLESVCRPCHDRKTARELMQRRRARARERHHDRGRT